MKTITLDELKDHVNEIILAEEEAEGPVDQVEVLGSDKDEVDNTSPDESTALVDGAFKEEQINLTQEIQDKTPLDPSSKFKSVEDLEKAYNALEKEFTRRCQRLSKLEKELSDTIVKDETPQEWKGKVDKFFNENPQAKPLARAIAEEIVKDGALRKRKDCLETALSRAIVNTYKSPKDLATDEDFLRTHIISSDFVKKAVIEGYLKDLREGKPPVLMSKSGQTTVAPRNKPKTIEEAGKMFCQNHK